jgi:hypothetical protein
MTLNTVITSDDDDDFLMNFSKVNNVDNIDMIGLDLDLSGDADVDVRPLPVL